MQLFAASPTNRPESKVMISIVIINFTLRLAAGCKAKVGAGLSSHPLVQCTVSSKPEVDIILWASKATQFMPCTIEFFCSDTMYNVSLAMLA